MNLRPKRRAPPKSAGKFPCYRLYTLLIVVLLHIASVVVTELKKSGSLV